jgi:hypothetical protein
MFTAGSMATPGTVTRKLTATVSLAGWEVVTPQDRESSRRGSWSKEPTFVGQVCVETRAFVYVMRQDLALESGNGESYFKERVGNAYQSWSKH